ncbi:MAG: hypothetical protein P8K76_17210 [Candidatus Binatia bacterium]|nr:hypothetical protein [Candidatus Binatia bacterium]MDG2011503.1 hypothetical protein [Candidatus Binatia bacterium]
MALTVGALLLCLLGAPTSIAETSGEAKPETSNDLLIGYSLLDTTLSGESMLKWLLMVRQATFQSPAKATEDLLTRISKASAIRSKELKRLRELAPQATRKPPPSPIGDAIQDAASEAGEHEMLFPDGAFDIRFLFLQAQATRMISVMAAQVEKIDPNTERQAWLKEVSREYKKFRDELVDSLSECTPKD